MKEMERKLSKLKDELENEVSDLHLCLRNKK
jgi:hypothetical protein